jgi:hypothetical protein
VGYVLPNVEAINPKNLLPVQDIYCQYLKKPIHGMQKRIWHCPFSSNDFKTKTRLLKLVLRVAHRCRCHGPACRASLRCRCTQRSQSCCGNCTRGTCTRASRRHTRRYLQRREESVRNTFLIRRDRLLACCLSCCTQTKKMTSIRLLETALKNQFAT